MLPLKPLTTVDGRSVEILDVGQHNNDQGPDFFNAKVKIDGVLWAGNVEIHLQASDWFRHGHDKDHVYDNTILHVVEKSDVEVVMADGRIPPQLELSIPDELKAHYEELLATDDYPRCHSLVPTFEPLKVHAWLDALLVERLQDRAGLVLKRLDDTVGDWEQTCFITLSRSFGFGLNGDAFELWAKKVPLNAAVKHRDNLLQIEAMFLGIAGLIGETTRGSQESSDKTAEEQTQKLQQEFRFLSYKFSLTDVMRREQWKFMRTRPKNHPDVRIRQIADIYHHGRCSIQTFLEARDLKALHDILSTAGIAKGSRNLVIINAIVPLLYAYGMKHNDTDLQDRAIDLLWQIPSEDNYILRQWRSCGLKPDAAADSQALIQLKREYCDKNDCLRCRFGYEYLSRVGTNGEDT